MGNTSKQTNETKHQHFVPKFYLENFSKDGRLFVYDRKESRFFQSTPEKMCKQNYIYETAWESADSKLGKYVLFNQLEQHFSNKETKWSIIIQNIVRRYELNKTKMPSGLICTKEEKDDLSEFIACTFLRHPYQLKKICDYYADLTTDDSQIEFVRSVRDLFKMLGWGSPKSLLEHSIKISSFNPDLEGSPLNVYMENLQQMNMFFMCSKNLHFITSSFPVFGTEASYQQVYFPISPKVIICCSDAPETRNKRNRFNYATPESVNFLNTMYLAQPSDSCRYLISHDKEVLSRAINIY